MRRALYAAVAVAILVLTGLSLYPRMQPEYALAQSALAMSKIKSAHAVGWSMTPSGEKKRLEYWVKGEKTRMFCEGLYEGASDGKVLTEVRLGCSPPKVLIQPAENVEPDMTLSLFHGPEAVDKIIKNYRAEFAGTRHANLPNGDPALVSEVRGCTKRWLFYIDPDTDLLVRYEAYTDGRLWEAIETFEYDVPLSDSVFRISIPKATPVTDLTAPVSPEKKKWRHNQHVKLYQEGAEVVTSIPSGEEESRFHPEYTFKCIGSGGLLVYYVPDKDMYWVLGKAEVTGPNGFSEIVEDNTIQLPSQAQIYEILMDKGKPGAVCNADKAMIGGYECVRFVNVGTKPLTVKWDTARHLFIVEGKARLLPQGTVHDNGTVNFYADQLAKVEKPVWTGLPSDEAALAQEQFDILKRSESLLKSDPRMTGAQYINGGKVELDGRSIAGMRRGHYSSGYGLSIEQVTKAVPYIYIVPSQEKYYVVGTAKVKVKGQPDRLVKNGIVAFDGTILETERPTTD